MDWLLFVSKKVISALAYPLGISLLLWFLGIVLWLFRPRSRAGFLCVLAGGVWLLGMSFPLTGFLMLRELELRAGGYADPETLVQKKVGFVVVLGGDIRQGELTPADRLACTSLVRLMEGVRLWKGIPGAKLVLSGGNPGSQRLSSGEAMAIVARELGVPRGAMLVEAQSWDTQDEATFLKPLLGASPFALVTSASHMPRAMMSFKMAGLNPFPAPADFEAAQFRTDFRAFLPGSASLERSRRAIHEYLGILVLLVKQWTFR